MEKSNKQSKKSKGTEDSINRAKAKDKSKSDKKKRFSIPEYDVDIEFAQDIIQVLDCSTDRLLDSKNMEEKELINLDNVIRRSFQSFRAKSESGKNYLVNLNFVSQHDVLSTGGEYILDISMITPYHGFYFGLYEIGEFRIDQQDLTLHLINSYPCKYVGSGTTITSKIPSDWERELYFGLRETKGDSVDGPLAWSPKRGEAHKILWKKPVPAAVMSLRLQYGLLFIGMKNGDVQIINLNSDFSTTTKDEESEVIMYKGTQYRVIEKHAPTSESSEVKIEKVLEEVEHEEGPEVIFNQKVFEGDLRNKNKKEGEVTQIEYLPELKRIPVIGGVRQQKGGVAIFPHEGELLLNTLLGDSILKGISQTPMGLFLTNASGVVYHLRSDFMEGSSSKNITKVHLNKEVMSNIVVVRDWVCMSGAETLSFVFTKDMGKRSSSHLDDTLARCVR
ncbi:MAG: hypothetical protein ACTSRD_07720, partial [Promethearchaeota archaeon]